MIRPILLYGDSILRMKSEEAIKINKDLPHLIRDMKDTLENTHGVGLSAIQIGIPIRIFIINANLDNIDFHFSGIFINPKILKEEGPIVKNTEGCLSIPQLNAMVDRFSKIKLYWLDENWEENKEEFTGMKSIIIQHEFDHLEGILYVDKVNQMWKSILEDGLDKISKREIEILYPWK